MLNTAKMLVAATILSAVILLSAPASAKSVQDFEAWPHPTSPPM